MSLEAAKEKLPGVPEELVVRSASARATASGVSTEDVLASWAGGGDVPAGGGPAAPAAATDADAPAEAAPATAAAAAPVAVAPAGPTVQVVMVDPVLEEAPVDPVPVGERVRVGTIVGLALGAIAGIIGGALAFGSVADNMIVTEGAGASVVILDPSRATTVLGIYYALAGLVIALVASALPGRLSRGHRLSRNTTVTAMGGLVVGAAFGVASAAILTAGEPVIGQEPAVSTGAVGAFFWTAMFGVVLGIVVAIFAQLVGRPAGVDEAAEESAEEVRKRLVTAYLVPIVLLGAMAVIIVALGTVFLEFLSFAPIIAIVVAGALLTFGFLATSRPNMKVNRTDVAVAASGLAILVVFLAAIAFSWSDGGDHGEEGDHGGEGEEEAIVRVLPV